MIVVSEGVRATSALIETGLARLRKEAFVEGGPGFEAEEIISTSIIHQAWSSRTEAVRRGGAWGFRKFGEDFPDDSMDRWLVDVRRESYVPGQGTWTSCKVYLFDSQDGRLEIFDEELPELDATGNVESQPASAGTLFQDLKAFPRTSNNIPEWMWEVFKAEGVKPPIYNPDFKTVDWDNKRLPVSGAGTDFSVAPAIIDESKEPGFFSKISKKLFG